MAKKRWLPQEQWLPQEHAIWLEKEGREIYLSFTVKTTEKKGSAGRKMTFSPSKPQLTTKKWSQTNEEKTLGWRARNNNPSRHFHEIFSVSNPICVKLFFCFKSVVVRVNTISVGWKPHDGFPDLLVAFSIGSMLDYDLLPRLKRQPSVIVIMERNMLPMTGGGRVSWPRLVNSWGGEKFNGDLILCFPWLKVVTWQVNIRHCRLVRCFKWQESKGSLRHSYTQSRPQIGFGERMCCGGKNVVMKCGAVSVMTEMT